jgi:hypothetical protein
MHGEPVYRLTEEVAGLGQYGRTLTLLTCSNLTMRIEEADDDEDDDDALIESWTPKIQKIARLNSACGIRVVSLRFLLDWQIYCGSRGHFEFPDGR